MECGRLSLERRGLAAASPAGSVRRGVCPRHRGRSRWTPGRGRLLVGRWCGGACRQTAVRGPHRSPGAVDSVVVVCLTLAIRN
ncbi:hypothetical protein HBB16_09355, partial [Pseudonocardia sp. MCCB 268]|nr:hypothetical protein [Pseudonocardia cytotoxica]